jgi:hypothetical protein
MDADWTPAMRKNWQYAVCANLRANLFVFDEGFAVLGVKVITGHGTHFRSTTEKA